MIERFNRKQVLLAGLNVFLGVGAFLFAFLFFYFTARLLIHATDLGVPRWTAAAIASSVVVIIAVSGFARARSGRGYSGIEDSALSVGILDSETGGSHAMGRYARRVTGPAYLLSQIFLGGPLQIAKAIGRIRSRIPAEHGLEGALETLLREMKTHGKWQDVKAFGERSKEISCLIRMGKVEFSQRRGRVKAAKDC